MIAHFLSGVESTSTASWMFAGVVESVGSRVKGWPMTAAIATSSLSGFGEVRLAL